MLEALRLATETTRNRLPKCIIPFVITVDEAAAPQSSLMFMFWGGVVIFPLMLVYTLISYSVFRGKVRTTAGNY